MGGFEGPDKLAGLLVVCVGGEGDVVHRHLQQQLLTRHGSDLIWLRHDVLHTKAEPGQTVPSCGPVHPSGAAWRPTLASVPSTQ